MSVFPGVTGRNHSRGPLLVVRTGPRNRAQGILQAGPLRLRCALGRAGITCAKREGDGATPIATMALLGAWRPGGLKGPRPAVALPVRRTGARDGWCDEPRHASYNRPVRLPLAASAEAMRRADGLYDLVVVLDWNLRARARGRGSAIFLHVARAGWQPTEGCVALHPRDLLRLAPFLRPGARLRVVA